MTLLMTLSKILLFSFLTTVISCKGQENTNPVKRPNPSKPRPTVVKNFRSVGLAPDFDTTLVSQYIRSIFQDSKGNLWFGTIDEGVVKYDEKTLTYFSNSDGFINTSVFAITEDKSGNLWFGTDQGVYKYDGKVFKQYHQKDGLNHIDISRKGILVDKSGTIWIGTHSGVYRYDPSAERRGGMAQDHAGNMWFTMNNGICKYDEKTLTEFTAKDGLGGTEFWGIIIEQSGVIWVTARGSTTRFDPAVPLPDAFTVFTPADGFTCCVQSVFEDKSGRMWWGTGQGLYRFDGQRFYQVKQNGPW